MGRGPVDCVWGPKAVENWDEWVAAALGTRKEQGQAEAGTEGGADLKADLVHTGLAVGADSRDRE